LVKPSVALDNNAQREHLEFMHTVEAVAQENGSVISALASDGCAVYPAGDAFSALWKTLAQGRQVCAFGPHEAEVSLIQADWVDAAWQVRVKSPQGNIDYRLHIAGRHNVGNSLAAAACALSAGVSKDAVAKGLTDFEPVKGRSRALSMNWGARLLTLVDDTYNANPDSVRAAIDVLAELPGPRLLVLGDMGEVGDQGPAFHAEIGAYAHDRQIEQVLCLGDLARHTAMACPGAQHFADIDTLIGTAKQALAQTSSALIKGSRFMKMERVVQAIQNTSHTTERASC
jgi:UDP-N-acetylmuramyl pentapeptide synthase